MKPKIKLYKNQLSSSSLIFWLASISIMIITILLSSNTVKAQYIPFTKITDDHFTQNNPVIDGNFIVYQDTRGGGLNDIYLYNRITKSKIALTSDPAVESINPDISGNRVVWADNRDGNWEIYNYNVNTPGVDPQPLFVWEGDQTEPAIHGDVMVFTDEKPGNTSYNIYLYEFNTGVLTRLTDDTDGDQRNPDVYGDYVVWQDQRSGDWDIYMYCISTREETQLTDDPGYQSSPAIHGNRVVWQDDRNGNWDIYLHHITFGLGNDFYNFDWPVYSESIGKLNKQDQIHPAIYGDYVVWEDFRSGDWDLYLYTFINDLVGYPSQILDEDYDQKNGNIYENFVVFQDERDNDGGTDIWQWEMPPGIDLALIIEDTPDPATTGDDLTYEVFIKNTGLQDANDCIVTCILPDGVDVKYILNSSGMGASTVGNEVSCELGTMAINDRDTIKIVVTPLDEAILTFQASVTTSDDDNDTGNNAQTITTEVVWGLSDIIGEGVNPSIQLDENSAVHVVWQDNQWVDNQMEYNICYATNKSGAWMRETILEANLNVTQVSQLAIDQHGKAHVVYSTWSELWYLNELEQGWSEPVKLADTGTLGLSIGCSPDGIVYVSYLKSMWGDNINLLYYNGSWNGPIILNTNPSGRASNDLAMAVDGDGYIHFAYYLFGTSNDGAHYITNAPDSVWKASELIQSDWGCAQCEGMKICITTDDNNAPHVAYSSTYENYLGENNMYATKSSNTWTYEMVSEGGRGNNIGLTDITTGISQEPYMYAYASYWYKLGGAWEYKTLAWEANEICDMEVDDDGYVHFVYSHYDNEMHGHVIGYFTTMPEPPKPQISINPTEIDFWQFVVGDTTEAKKVIIKNKGDAILQLNNISLAWNDSIHFTITNNTCSNLNPSDTCSVDIVFNPQTMGDKKALLWIESNDPANPIEAAVLEGKGMAPMVWDYGSLAFGEVSVGDSSTSVYTIKNKGNINLQIKMVVIQEDDATDFYYTGLPDTPFNIGENDSIVFNIVFKPGSSGDKTSKLKIFTNDLDLTRILTGTTPTFTIEGEIIINENTPVNSGRIFLFQLNNGIAIQASSKPLSGSETFIFNGIPEGTITLRIDPDTIDYPGYLKTYLGNTAFYNEADVFVLNKDTSGLEITLIPAPPPPNGNSEISGVFVEEDGTKSGNMVTYGKYLGDGTPISEASVFLIDNSGNIFDTDNTNSSGEFVFEKIPVGKYKFAADYVGFSMDDSNDSLIIDQENQKYSIAAIANNNLITIDVENTTSIRSFTENDEIHVYPNPAQDHIILQCKGNLLPDTYTANITSLSGRLIHNSNIELKEFGQEFIIRIDDLPSGIYIISLSGNKTIYKARFIKVE